MGNVTVGQNLGTLYQPYRFNLNESVTAKSDQTSGPFKTVEEAQKAAVKVAAAADKDAAVIEKDGQFYVVEVDEVRELDPGNNAVPGQFRIHGADPSVVSFAVSRQDKPGEVITIRPDRDATEMSDKDSLMQAKGVDLNQPGPVFEALLMRCSEADLGTCLNDDACLQQLQAISQNPEKATWFVQLLKSDGSNVQEALEQLGKLEAMEASLKAVGFPDSHSHQVIQLLFDPQNPQGVAEAEAVVQDMTDTLAQVSSPRDRSRILTDMLKGSPQASASENAARIRQVAFKAKIEQLGADPAKVADTLKYFDSLAAKGIKLDYDQLLSLVQNQTAKGQDPADVLGAVQAYGIIQEGCKLVDEAHGQSKYLAEVGQALVAGALTVDADTQEDFAKGVWAQYSAKDDRVYLEDFNINSPQDRAYLFHELTHASHDIELNSHIHVFNHGDTETEAYRTHGLYLLAYKDQIPAADISDVDQISMDTAAVYKAYMNTDTNDYRQKESMLGEYHQAEEKLGAFLREAHDGYKSHWRKDPAFDGIPMP